MLTYDDKEHAYTWFGVPIPSLSKLMVDTGWGRDKDLAGVPPRVLELARIRGTQAHSAIDAYLSGGDYEAELSDASAPYFESFLKVAPDLPLTEEGVSELPVGGWCGYGTTPDRDEPEALMEIKATYAIHPSTYIQLAGQEWALRGQYEGEFGKKPRMVVHLQKDGRKAKILLDKDPHRTLYLWRNELDKIAWKKAMKWK